MPRDIKKRSIKKGLPPGTLVHIGEKSKRDPLIRVMQYNDERFEEKSVASVQELPEQMDESMMVWIEVEGLHKIEIVSEIGERLGLHPLVLEDILNTNQRPKQEDYGQYLFIVLSLLEMMQNDVLATEQVSIVLGPNYVVSFLEGIDGDIFKPVRDRIRKGNRIRAMGPDYLAYALMDSIIDNYFSVLEAIGERIEQLENEVITRGTTDTIRKIHQLKREMIFVRRAVWPLRDVIGSLERMESGLITQPVTLYLRDLYDHNIQVIDTIETNRDMLSGILDVYMSRISYKTNETMRVLTVIATIFMPISFLTSLWGMNFKKMPELELPWGYPAALFIMAVMVISMLLWFRKRRWL